MAGVLGRTVMARHRYARLWGLGDRNDPTAQTPGVVLMEGDPTMPLNYAPFESTSSGTLPSVLEVRSRGSFGPPDFGEIGPHYSVSVGHVLPPSLEDANAGEVQGTSALLPVSWQRMHHDASLMDPALAPEIVVLTDAVQLASQPGKLPTALMTLKHRFPGALVWAPGLGGADNLAALVSMGVDLVDLARCRQATAHGMVLTQNGPREPLAHEASNLETQVYHLMKAMDEARAAIANGSLGVLATRASLSSPRMVEHLRRHQALTAEQVGVLSSHVDANHVFECFSSHVLDDPVVVDWERFICERYEAPEQVREVMILLPCSAKKPYRLSKSHGQFLRAINSTGFHEVMMTSPLGLVPRDLEDVWPAANYDVPVTGDWSLDELDRVQRMLKHLTARAGYKRIINHTNLDVSFLEVEVVNTRGSDGATQHEALERLKLAAKDAVSTFELRNQKNSRRLLEHYRSIARKTTGTDAWCKGLEVRGKLPRWRLELNGQQLAVWSVDRNGFSFSKASIDVLDEHKALPEIELHPEVNWKGDVFTQHVRTFDSTIRRGDDLRVMQNGGCIGLARAHAPGWEWGGTPGTLAKSHQRKKKP
jgi:archaeosine synthase